MFFLKPFIVSLFIFTTNCDVIKKTNYSHFFPENLGTFCPFTSFCGENASVPFLNNPVEVPCCRNCSCDQQCGLHYNCCFKKLDLYNLEETFEMICKSTYAPGVISNKEMSVNEFGPELHFRMINKCLKNPSPRLTLTEEAEISLFQPVYSEKNGFIYFNEDIAKCNGIRNAVAFPKAITCLFKGEYSTEDDFIVKDLQLNKNCITEFIPPDGVNLKSERCEPDVIRKCNSNNSEEDQNMLQILCESFNATYLFERYGKIYYFGNIYCYKCNVLSNDATWNMNGHICNASLLDSLDEMGKFKPKQRSLTMFLIPGILESSNGKNIGRVPSDCPENHVMVHSYEEYCRPVMCPNWKIRVKGKCMFYSHRWYGGSFVVLLRLNPVDDEMALLRIFIDGLSKSDKHDLSARWIKRKTLIKNWTFLVFQPYYQNSSFVDYLVVKAIFTFDSASPVNIAKQVKAAVRDTWYIVQNNVKIAMKVEFNRYKLYSKYILSSKGNIYLPVCNKFIAHIIQDQLEFVYVPENLITLKKSNLTCMPEKVLNLEEVQQKSVLKISSVFSSSLVNEIVITKLFFCQQVDLFPNEYEDNGDSIFFKVKNVTLYSFRKVNSDAVIKAASYVNASEIGRTVRICLYEFANPLNDATFTIESYWNILMIVKLGLNIARIALS